MNYFETNKTHPNVNWRPWDHSTGPKGFEGKSKASKNSHRHGFYCETFRKLRKTRRRTEVIRFEWECLGLIRAVEKDQFDKVEKHIDKLKSEHLVICGPNEHSDNDSNLLAENYYVSALLEKTLRYSLKRVLDYQDKLLMEAENEKQ